PPRLGRQRLPDGVVVLVRAGVVEASALEEQPDPAAQLRELRRLAQRRGAPDEVGQDVVQLAAKGAVAPHAAIGALELLERRHQRFRDVLAAEFAEVAVPVGKTWTG